MQLQECLSKASGEGRGGLCDSTLGSGQLSGKSGQEVVLSLLRSQDGYRRQYAECICGQEDNLFRCRSCGNRAYNLLNMVDGIGYTGVLRYALIIEIDLSISIQRYVLQQSVALDGVVDIRLGLFVQIDNLRVASAFEVEDTVVIPAVLIITDQQTFGICGQSSLTSSGQTEEDSGVLAVQPCKILFSALTNYY